MIAFGNCFIEFGKVFLPKKISPLFRQGFSSSVDKFKKEVLGKKVKDTPEDKEGNLEYWEEELDKMDKK